MGKQLRSKVSVWFYVPVLVTLLKFHRYSALKYKSPLILLEY
jgi:hypothetical protein